MASIEMSVLTDWQPYTISYTILPLWLSLWNLDNGQYRDVCTYRVTTIRYILYNITIMNITRNLDNGQYRDVSTYRVTTICYILYNITIMNITRNRDNGQYRDVSTYRVTTICYILYNITIMNITRNQDNGQYRDVSTYRVTMSAFAESTAIFNGSWNIDWKLSNYDNEISAFFICLFVVLNLKSKQFELKICLYNWFMYINGLLLFEKEWVYHKNKMQSYYLFLLHLWYKATNLYNCVTNVEIAEKKICSIIQFLFSIRWHCIHIVFLVCTLRICYI